MPLSIRRRDRRRAPATDTAAANAATTNAESSKNVPSEAMGRRSLSVTGCRSRTRGAECQTPEPTSRPALPRSGGRPARASLGRVLRRAFCHHAVWLHVEDAIGERALQHHLRLVLERVGKNTGVVRRDDLAVVFHVKAVLKRIRIPRPGFRGHEAVELELLALPRLRIRHDLINVLVVLGALAER